MQRMNRHDRALYLATYAQVHGRLVAAKSYREKPLIAARDAREHALAAIEVHRPTPRKVQR